MHENLLEGDTHLDLHTCSHLRLSTILHTHTHLSVQCNYYLALFLGALYNIAHRQCMREFCSVGLPIACSGGSSLNGMQLGYIASVCFTTMHYHTHTHHVHSIRGRLEPQVTGCLSNNPVLLWNQLSHCGQEYGPHTSFLPHCPLTHTLSGYTVVRVPV